MVDLSIIILSYNTEKLLDDCLNSLNWAKSDRSLEVIIVDNGSKDGSINLVQNKYKWTKLIQNGSNIGFAKGNNAARKVANGKHILFLNSDTVVTKEAVLKSLDYIKNNQEIGALTCKLKLPNGNLDRDARRSFPTPWVSLTHLILHLDKIFPKSKIFAKYWYGYKNEDETHEVDVIQGAFFLTTKYILDKVGWFSEEYFLDGEDIDLCWKIKQLNKKIIYYPEASILHIKGASKGKHKKSIGKITKTERLKYVNAGLNSMEIFYRKWYWNKYPYAFNIFVLTGISLLKFLRTLKAYLT